VWVVCDKGGGEKRVPNWDVDLLWHPVALGDDFCGRNRG